MKIIVGLSSHHLNRYMCIIYISCAGDDPSSHKIKVLTISETDSSHIKMKTATASLEGDVGNAMYIVPLIYVAI